MQRIKWRYSVSSAVLCMALGATGFVWAQEGRPEMVPPGVVTTGKLEYRSHCAQCHGPNAKGDGPVAAALTKKPTDLTMLAKNNKGDFPEKRVESFINGSETVAAHGSREMPIWGVDFRKVRATGGVQAQRTTEEVNQRVRLLVDYIKSIQEK